MEQLLVRDLQAKDIVHLTGYWETLTPEDIDRMHIDVTKLHPKDVLESRLLTVMTTPTEER